jgi:nitrite reductase (NO-forming)
LSVLSKCVFLVLCAGGGGLAAAATLHAASTHAGSDRATAVTVAATEFRFRLSRTRIAAGGTVVFRVVNKGKIPHNFRIAGKKTRLLQPGQSAMLKVVFRGRGTYAYACTVPGHAAAGMKGVFGVGVQPPPTTSTTTTTGGPATTVDVAEFEFGFTLSQTTVPAGTLTFVMRNTGTIAHNFDLRGVPLGAGPILDAGQTASMTVTVAQKGTYKYVCDVPGHADAGMAGGLVVD